ncbi:MAG TPA: hypothetical protein VGL33_13835 [Streptosporangiaceae bacterium]
MSSVLPDLYYQCPNIASVDQHIVELCVQLGNQPPLADAQRRQALREDIDRLLDRRLYLEMVREGSARVGSKPDQRANPQPYQSTAPGP